MIQVSVFLFLFSSLSPFTRNPVERALSEYAYFIENPSAMSPESFTALCSRQVGNLHWQLHWMPCTDQWPLDFSIIRRGSCFNVCLQVSEFNECRANVRREPAASSSPIGDGSHQVGAEVDDVLECMYFRAPRRNIRKGFVRVGYGIYVKPLEYWWRVFPRSQLLVLSSDEVIVCQVPKCTGYDLNAFA